MAKLTQKTLEAIGPDQNGSSIRDDGNLIGRIRAKADGEISVSFYFRYRSMGRRIDHSCGTWPEKSLSEIRLMRDKSRVQLGEKKDPASEKIISKHEVRAATAAKLAAIVAEKNANKTLQDMFDAWLGDGVKRKDDNAELIRSFNADVLPIIGTIQIKSLTYSDLNGVLKKMVGRGVNRAAVIMRNNFVQMFAWADERQPWRKLLSEGNPAKLIKIKNIVSKDYDFNDERSRVLSPDEIRELRDVFDKSQISFDTAPNRRSTERPIAQTTRIGAWIMLSTMCRVGEMLKSRWENIDLEKGTWLIPKRDVKDNVAELNICLSNFSIEQFKQLKELAGDSKWCFPTRRKDEQNRSKSKDIHVCVKSISKQVGDRQSMFKKAKDGTPRKKMACRKHDNTLVLADGKNGAWTPHDLRRTGATMMQGLGVSLDIIDRCQNHILAGSKVRRAYLHYDYADEKREAWQLLGDRLEQILKPAEIRNTSTAA